MNTPTRRRNHDCAEIFPMLPKAKLQALADDIRANGLLDEIVLHDEAVLDGRNRDLACEMAGVEPRYVTWNGECGTPLAFVISKNKNRRQLTKSQSALAAAKALPLFEAEGKERMVNGGRRGGEAKGCANSHNPSEGVRSATLAARSFGVSARLVHDAKTVLNLTSKGEVAEKTLAKVSAGTRTLNDVLTEYRAAKKTKKATTKKTPRKGKGTKKTAKKKAPHTKPADEDPEHRSEHARAAADGVAAVVAVDQVVVIIAVDLIAARVAFDGIVAAAA